jgi:UDP:flavonoid glycosyltransferase YjiC (YdhE family)
VRVLVVSWAWPTHFYPMVPLAWTLRAAGHDVRVASQPGIIPHVVQSGLAAVVVGHDLDTESMSRRAMNENVAGDVTRKPTPEQLRKIVLHAFGMFARIAEDMTEDLLVFAQAWKPDVIVYEPTTYAGPIVATKLGVPAIRQLWGIDYTSRARPYEPELLSPLLRRIGLDEVETLGDLTIDPCPPVIQHHVQTPRQEVTYVPYNGPGSLPRWLLEPPTRPRICLTWGTSSSRMGAELFIAPDVLRRIDTSGTEVVATISNRSRESFPMDLPNLRVVENLPLHLLLPTCDLIVQQGGMGTSMTAMVCGIPQIVVPQLPDQTFNARKLAESKAVTNLHPRQARTPGVLSEHIERILHTPGQRESAAALRTQATQRPPLEEAVKAIAGLAG